MDLLALARLVTDEQKAFQYLLSRMRSPSCPFCSGKTFYIMSRTRLRCSRCRNDFRPLRGTAFSLIRMPLSKWLILMKLFELATSARKAAKEVKVNYNTALKAFDAMRRVIVNELAKNDLVLKGEIEADESYFGGRRKGRRGRGSRNKAIVYGILERNGKVSVSILKDVSTESIINETVKKVRRGSIVYTDRWRGYSPLMFCGYRHLSVDHSRKFKEGKVYINGIDGFWSFAKERLIKYHGISKEKFLYYIKEMEWRYNNRDRDLYALLVDYMLGAAGKYSPKVLFPY
jgi:transposase